MLPVYRGSGISGAGISGSDCISIDLLVPKTNQIGLDNPGPKVVGMQALVDLLAAVVFFRFFCTEISNTAL